MESIQEQDFNDDPTNPFHEQIYQAILRLRFGFGRTLLLMRTESTLTSDNAKSGGGILDRHDAAFNVLDLRVRLDDFGGTVSLNSATDAASSSLKLVDAARPLGINDGNVSTLINGTALDYKS